MKLVIKGKTWADIQAQLKTLVGGAPVSTGANVPGVVRPIVVEPQEVEAEEVPELDSAGLPWDERIHASTKSLVKDGTWKVKRGVLPEEVDAIRGAVAPVEPVAPPAPPASSGAPDNLQAFTAYAAKINASGKGTYSAIQKFLADLGIVNIVQVPTEKLAELSEKMKVHFCVEF